MKEDKFLIIKPHKPNNNNRRMDKNLRLKKTHKKSNSKNSLKFQILISK